MVFTNDEMRGFRERLLDLRQQLSGRVEHLAKDAAESTTATELSKSPLSPAENASEAFQQDFAFMGIESEEVLIRKIDVALASLDNGTYGTCQDCEEAIPNERLEAIPFATLCIRCQEKQEKRSGRNRGMAFEIGEDDYELSSAGDDLG